MPYRYNVDLPDELRQQLEEIASQRGFNTLAPLIREYLAAGVRRELLQPERADRLAQIRAELREAQRYQSRYSGPAHSQMSCILPALRLLVDELERTPL